MYLSLVIALLGLSVLFLSIWFFLSTIILGVVLDHSAVRSEEAYLEKKFGDDYTAYRKKVRKWI
jgi:protein-S-isoprenylcysteine O-methyltransferase Ste14